MRTFPGIKEIRRTYPTVTYVDDGGRTHSFVFDFCAVSETGHRLALVVAPTENLERRLSTICELAKAQGLSGSGDTGRLADFARVWNWNESPKRSVEIASAILRSRESFDERDVQSLLGELASMPRCIRFSRLIEGIQDAEKRRNSIWRLVDLQVLKVSQTEYGHLDDLTLIRK